MKKILNIAAREYVSTAMTKGFIIGAFVVPAVIVALIPVIILLTVQAKPPKVVGSVALLDPTGVVADGVEARLGVEKLAQRQLEQLDSVKDVIAGTHATTEEALQYIEQHLPELPEYRLERLPADADIEAEKASLRGKAEHDAGARLALALVAPDAVKPAEGAEAFGSYELFFRPGLDARNTDDIRSAVQLAIRDARYRDNGLDPADVLAMATVEGQTKEVTETGEERDSNELTMFLPLVFMVLLTTSVLTGGQYLLTTTIEEKSSRVVEVLLSAVSPLELMSGKILGQLGVGLTLLFIYSGLGTGVLAFYSLGDVIGFDRVLYLFAFFLVAYFMVASLLAAIGASVSELREAQSLMTPVMLVVMVPYILWLPISQSPNGLLARVLSFVPPACPFVMMMRIASTDPPPAWEVLVSLAVGITAAIGFTWAAAKIFRVGLLMFGKPPNFATLIKWIRMA